MEWIFNDDRPIWLQINEQLRRGIVIGLYPAGERLPSVRELASEAGVNPNTMQRALAQLETDGLAVTNRTTGRVVTDDSAVLKELREKMAESIIESFMRDMEALGFTAAEVASLLAKRGEENGN